MDTQFTYRIRAVREQHGTLAFTIERKGWFRWHELHRARTGEGARAMLSEIVRVETTHEPLQHWPAL